jgi:hypothetical protein
MRELPYVGFGFIIGILHDRDLRCYLDITAVQIANSYYVVSATINTLVLIVGCCVSIPRRLGPAAIRA